MIANKRTIAAVAAALAVAALSLLAFPYEGSIVFQGGQGAKALGMAGAFTALADDASAALWNPAGLALAEGVWLGGSASSLFNAGDIGVPFHCVAAGMPAGGFGLGFAWAYAEAGSLYNASMFAFTAATSVSSVLSLGASFKLYTERIDDESAWGLGLDAGLLFRPSESVTLGASARDLLANVGEGQALVPIYTLGAALGLLDGSALTLSADVSFRGGERPGLDEVRAGCELRLVEALALRAGMTSAKGGDGIARYSFGIGARSDGGLLLDLAVVSEGPLGTSYVGSVMWKF